MRHRWEAEPGKPSSGPVQLDVCERCGIRRRTRFGQGDPIPLVEYLITGVGWIEARAPECVDTKQLSLLPPPAEPEPDPPPAPVIVHKCHAIDCAEPVHPRYLMCRRHWWLVPAPVRELVNSTYQRGQERGKVRPSREWLAAVRLAIAAVADLEGKNLQKAPEPPASTPAAGRGLRLVRGGRS